jgi:hypothetical protein
MAEAATTGTTGTTSAGTTGTATGGTESAQTTQTSQSEGLGAVFEQPAQTEKFWGDYATKEDFIGAHEKLDKSYKDLRGLMSKRADAIDDPALLDTIQKRGDKLLNNDVLKKMALDRQLFSTAPEKGYEGIQDLITESGMEYDEKSWTPLGE